MKLFLFAFTLGVAVSGLFFIRLSHIEQVPEAIRQVTVQGVDVYRSILIWFRDDVLNSIWVPGGVELRSILAGFLFFLSTWWLLAFLKGIPGFFRDLSAFFPLGR